VVFIVTDSEGRRVRPAEPPYPPLMPPAPQSLSMYLRLMRDQIHGLNGEFPMRQLVPGPGTYRVVARIRSLMPASEAPSEEVWTSEQGPIESNPITIRVVP
jgi:hypothetical protein